MIEQILIIKESGISLFSWLPEEDGEMSQMVSGFLTAINMFAKAQKGEEIKEITMDPTTFIFQRFDDNILVILTQDPKFETIIFRILSEIMDIFIAKYGDLAANFKGDVSVFEPFSADIDRIMENYLYFDYKKTKDIFREKESFVSSTIFDRDQGDIAYIISKEFLDRKMLGLQGSIIVKTSERIIHEQFQDRIQSIYLVSKKNKSIFIKSTEKVILVQEISPFFDLTTLPTEINSSSLKKAFRQPGKLKYGVKAPFFMTEPGGVQTITNFSQADIQKDRLAVDLVTLLRAAVNLVQLIYKDELVAMGIVTHKAVHACLPLGGYSCFLTPFTGNTQSFIAAIEQQVYGPSSHPFSDKDFDHILRILADFVSYFT